MYRGVGGEVFGGRGIRTPIGGVGRGRGGGFGRGVGAHEPPSGAGRGGGREGYTNPHS